MKWKNMLISSVVAVGVIGSATTVFAATQSNQFAAINEKLAPAQMGYGWHRHGHRNFGRMTAVADVLGVTEVTLRSELQSGKSIAQIAKSKGMSETNLIAKLKANFKTNLDKAVKNGKLTSSQETNILSNFAAHAKQFVEHKGCAGPSGAPTKGSANDSANPSASGAQA